MSVLVLTGSSRRESYTRRLGEALTAALPGGQLAPRLTDLPYFDQDLEVTPPAEVEALRAQVRDADAIVVVTPEYNGTVPGLLGNAVDWLSRPYGAGVLRSKPAVAVAASPGGVGGVRGVVSLRTLLGNTGAHVLGRPIAVGDVAHVLDTGAHVLGRPIAVGDVAHVLDTGAVDEVVEQVAEALDEALAPAARAA